MAVKSPTRPKRHTRSGNPPRCKECDHRRGPRAQYRGKSTCGCACHAAT